MSLFRSTSESTPRPSRHPELDSGSSPTSRHPELDSGSPRNEKDPGSKPGMTTSVLGESTLHEAILASSSSVRDSLPEQHRVHFETLRQEIIDFAQAHEIPRESLSKPDALREAAQKLSTPDLKQLANLLERFEYLLVHHEPKKEDYTEAIEYTEKFYHLREQYDSQVSLLKEVGILKEGVITGIDGNEYPIPTLEQIAIRLFERRGELSTKHDQGFTKLLLVPFGMSLDSLRETLKQFLIKYKKNNPTFDLDTDNPLWISEDYQGADTGDSPKLVYEPQSFTKEGHGGKTKMEILKEQKTPGQTRGDDGWTSDNEWKGWTIHLLQSSDPTNLDSLGFAPIPRKGQGTPKGEEISRAPLEAGQSANKYLSILQNAQDDPNSSYFQESGMTPEDWIMAFIIHLSETGKPLDDVLNPTNTESYCYLTGAFFSSSVINVPFACWRRGDRRAGLGGIVSHVRVEDTGVRLSVII